MRNMFFFAVNFNQNIGNWDVANVTEMSFMFKYAVFFDQNLGKWDISKVVKMEEMFLNNSLSTVNYDATLIGWATDTSGNSSDGIDDIPTNIIFSGGNSTYCASESLRNELDTTYNWTISDGDQEANCFITTWKTDNSGTSNNNEITIPTHPDETYNYTVDWGDGTVDTEVTGDITHTFPVAGTYTVAITGLFPRIYFHPDLSGPTDRNKILTIEQWSDNPWTSMVFAFSFCNNLTITNPNIDSPNLSNTDNTSGMFNYCFNFNGDITNWDVSTIKRMQVMFRESRKFNQDIGSWDVSNVTNMASMFEGADDFDQNIGNWDISNLSNATDMFLQAGLSITNYDNTIVGWSIDSSGDLSDEVDDIPSNVTFSGGNSTYCLAENERNILSTTHNWNITDLGKNTSCISGFITTWKTNNSGDSQDNQITIPVDPDENYNYSIDWGDGTSNTGVTAGITHTYANPNVYTVVINGQFPRIFFDNLGDKEKLIAIEQWGDIDWQSMESAFHGCANLNINTIEAPNLSNVTNMTRMFEGCSTLNSDLSNWNVSQVETMNRMFANASNFNQDIGGWDVSNVSIFGSMFYNATLFNQDISGWKMNNSEILFRMFSNAINFNQDISGWNISNVTNMELLFAGATAFNQDIEVWNTSNVEYMIGMFDGATSFDQKLGDWDITNVIKMDLMFANTALSTANYDATLMGWATDSSGDPLDGIDDIPSGISFHGGNSVYCNSEYLRSELINEHSWEISDAGLDTNCSNGFITTWKTDNPGASNDNQITISTVPGETYNYTVDWGDGKSDTGVTGDFTHTYTDDPNYDNDDDNTTYTVTITGLFPSILFAGSNNDKEKILTIEQWGDNPWIFLFYAFVGCKNLDITNPNIDVPNLNNITNLSNMFGYCSAFNGDITNWDVSTVKDFSNMFLYAESFNQDIGNWDVSNARSLIGMFRFASAFNQNINNWNVGNVESMNSIFSDATNYNQNLSGWDISKVKYLDSMFYNASAFNQNISNWDVSSAENMYRMFSNATDFNQDVGGWDVSNVTIMVEMFESASSFNQDISNWNVGMVSNMSNMFAYANAFNQNLVSWDLTNIIDMADMFVGTSLSTSNYDTTLMGWATDTSGIDDDGIDDIPNNVPFGGGNSTFCTAEEARLELDITYGWTITDSGLNCGIKLSPKVYLQGAALNPN